MVFTPCVAPSYNTVPGLATCPMEFKRSDEMPFPRLAHKKTLASALASVAQVVEVSRVNWQVAGSIPDQDT